MQINDKLKKYIKKNVFPSYQKNDNAHDINHIKYVIDRSLKFADRVDGINYDMVYTIASFHDIGHYIDAKNHEKISSEMLLKDDNLKKFFSDEEIKIMVEAVEDHRASLEYEPRSVYGKIVSAADRNTSIDSMLERTYNYRLKHMPNAPLEEVIEDSKKHIVEKFGKDGYANKTMYFEDEDFNKFLEDVKELTSDAKAFRKRYIEVNKIKD